MTALFETYICAACDIADEFAQSERPARPRDGGTPVAIALLKSYFPRGCWRDESSLSGLATLLDATGIALEPLDSKSVKLRRRSRDTGPLDQAIRLREAFRQRWCGPREHLSKPALARLAAYARTGAGDRAGALAEALESVGFKSLGDWQTKWKRYRLIVPETGVTLELGKPSLRLARSREFKTRSVTPADELLLRHFPGFQRYTCAAQRDAIHEILRPGGAEVVIARLPTGSGKSLLYLLPSAEWRRRREPATSVIVSPLIALQNDQMRKIEEHYHVARLKGAQVNSTVDAKKRTRIYQLLRSGALDILLLSPEKLVDPFFQEILIESAKHIRLFVVDEAHMVAEWGQDFRPDFFRLGVVRNRMRDENAQLKTLLLSATLTRDSERIVLKVFHDPPAIAHFEEPSLRREMSIRVVRHDRDSTPSTTLRYLLPHVPRPCIVYCRQRKAVKRLRRDLRAAGIRRFMDYTGATPSQDRVERLSAFHRGDVDVVLATSAFGLGVDKADVRSVIHYEVPRSVDEYYQQIGRTGRDHRTSHAFLLYSPGSRGAATREKRAIIKTETAAARAQAMLSNRVDLPADGSDACVLPVHVCPPHIEDPSALNRDWNFAVLNILEQVGDLAIDRAVLKGVRVGKGRKPDRLDRYPVLRKALRPALRRTSGCHIDLATFAVAERVSFSELERALVGAVLDGAVELMPDESDEQKQEEWVLARRNGSDTWTPQHTQRLAEHRKQRRALVDRELTELWKFLGGRRCRMRAFEQVYGYNLAKDCGHCDICNEKLSMKPPR